MYYSQNGVTFFEFYGTILNRISMSQKQKKNRVKN